MLQQHPTLSTRSTGFARSSAGALTVSLARGPSEIRAAQRLRYQVFAEEMGARLYNREAGVDSDMYDPWCDHLIVRDAVMGRVVGTYRQPFQGQLILPSLRTRAVATCRWAWRRDT
jgi:putative hemolysin